MNPFKTHGAFSWAELQTSDPAAATKFYNAIFGWTTRTMDMPTGEYTIVSAVETPVGGIMKLQSEEIPTHWSFYVTVDDIDAIVASAEALGGSIVMPVLDVETVGKLCAIKDRQGAVIMVIQYAPPSADKPSGEVDVKDSYKTHGAMSWVELRTSDMDGAISFYSGLFGWTVKVDDMEFGQYGTIGLGDTGIGGMCGLMDPNMPPHWGGYITVDDADAAFSAATEAGGTVIMPPTDIPNVGRFTIFLDPQGGALAAIKYVEMLTSVE